MTTERFTTPDQSSACALQKDQWVKIRSLSPGMLRANLFEGQVVQITDVRANLITPNKGKWDRVISDTESTPVTKRKTTPNLPGHTIPHRILRRRQGDTRAPREKFGTNDKAWLAESWQYPYRGTMVNIHRGTQIEILTEAMSNSGLDMSGSMRDPNLHCFYQGSWNVEGWIVDWRLHGSWLDADYFAPVAETRAPPDPAI